MYKVDNLQIYGHGTKGTQGSPPPKDFEKYGKSPNGAYNLLSNRDEDHSRVRKIFTPAFSDRALKQQEPLFLRYANKLVSKIREAIEQDPNKKIDMVIMYNFTTFDVMVRKTRIISRNTVLKVLLVG
jgi:cytochrome P450